MEELYLGIDALYDRFTLVGTPLKDSPHFDLMRAMDTGELNGCVYLSLEQNGRLDSRDAFYRSPAQHKEAYLRACKALEDGTAPPVQYYIVDGNKYIHDGKHRAALCAYRGMKVRAVEIPPAAVYTPFIGWVLQQCKKNPAKLSKNLTLAEAVTLDYERSVPNEQELYVKNGGQ